MKPILRVLAGATLLLLAVSTALGAGPKVPPAPTRFVTDKADALSNETEESLERRLKDFEAQTSNQLLVYIEDEVPEGTTVEEYTVACAQAWRAGEKAKKNGLVLFVFPGSKVARFEVGYGLEGALPDALASRIMNDEVVPRFMEGDVDGGVTAGVEAAIQATKGEYRGTGRKPAPTGR
ncbi:MAG TPA: TPM domain-containing protein, partial [Thermoanaerobaculia bacterium]|nr:TPM domain-containing protein [Thermoanaerobaculia bacterium]